MVTRVEITGFEEFDKYVQDIDPNGPTIMFYFSGSKAEDGKSWCPDCVEVFYGCRIPAVGNMPLVFELFEVLDRPVDQFIDFTAEPVVQSYLGELEKNIIFAYVDVGDMAYWKDKACPFRTDTRTRLMVIPTIIKWKGVQRLEGSQCNKRDLLQMLFEDED